jgi:hypothetical protein
MFLFFRSSSSSAHDGVWQDVRHPEIAYRHLLAGEGVRNLVPVAQRGDGGAQSDGDAACGVRRVCHLRGRLDEAQPAHEVRRVDDGATRRVRAVLSSSIVYEKETNKRNSSF